ncbi:MAG: translation initiation factor IF-3 [Clostridia bacterium]|nr:translation initiation factor IF-3 [Clostridia bacterium]
MRVRRVQVNYVIIRVALCFAARYFFKKGRYTVIKNQHQINDEIRDREVRLIGENGEMLGVMSARAALEIAEQADLDLVKISPNAVPPVCKVMDYGKFKFETLKRQKEAKKNQKTVEVKEVWLSMTIDVGDLNVKAKQTLKFLAEGNKVKVSIRMRGRQNAHADLGVEVMNKFAAMLGNAAIIEKKPLTENRNIIMIVAPATK